MVKNYKDIDVIRALENETFKKVYGEKLESDYLITPNKIYSEEELLNLSDEERKQALDVGYSACEGFINSVMNYQHLIDNNSDLSEQQRELLRVFLKSDVYFVPCSFGDWNHMHIVEKVDLVKKLLDGQWTFDHFATSLDDDIYYIEITFQELKRKKEFFNKNEIRENEQLKTFKILEIYIPYCDYLSIYRNVYRYIKSEEFEKSIKKDDYTKKEKI